MSRRGELAELVSRGLALAEDERQLFLEGDFDDLETMTQKKSEFLDELAARASRVRADDEERQALSQLIRHSQRNEQIMAAARSGFRAARRRVESILATRKGAVAYDENGNEITSRADSMGKTSRA